MKYCVTALIPIAFCALLGVAVYVTGSATPLWALLLMPVITYKEE